MSRGIIILLSFFLFYSQSFCQLGSPNDTLRKYSYLLKGICTNGSIKFGTGFFIKTHKNLFLVSARHLFVGHDDAGNYWDSIYIRCSNKPDQNNEFCIGIDLKTIRGKIDTSAYYKSPDVYFFKMKIKESIKIYSIENFIYSYQTKPYNPDSVISYGFGENSILGSPQNNNLKTAVAFRYSGIMVNKITTPIEFSELHAIVNNLYSASPHLSVGMSGSPVFLVFSTYNGKTKYISFGGLAMGESSTVNIINNGYIVRPDSVIKKLQGADRQDPLTK